MLRLKIILQYNFIFFLLLILSCLLSLIRCSIDKPSKFDINETELKGTVISKTIDGDKFSFEILSKEKLKCTYYIKTEEEKENLKELELGIEVLLKGTLSEPMNNTIPNTFNYKKYLKRNNINYQMTVDNFEVINNKKNFLYKIKNVIIKHLSGYKSEAYMKAFIMGDKNSLDEVVLSEYQSLGVSHIFAISGMHVSLLTAVILRILRKIRISENISYLIVILFLLFYLFLTNFQASILRSVLLFILLFINRKYDLDIKVINILYLDIALILLVFPNFLTNVGFLYSSIVSYSLIKYNHYIKGRYIVKTLKISLIAFLFSLPITIMNNYQINILSVINNLVIVPAVSFILYPLSVLSFMIKPLDNVLLFLLNILEILSKNLFTLNIIFPKVNLFIIIIYYILLTLFFESYKKIFLLMIFLILTFVKISPFLDNSYHIYFLDVGQGDSIVIKKGMECIMIDTGGKVAFKKDKWKERKEYYYTDSTITFLHSIGVSKLDYAVITHGDADHAKEINHLIDNIRVKKVIINKGSKNYLEENIPEYLITSDYQGKMNLKLLDTGIIYDNENDNSVISLLNAYNYNVLFMGDASMKVEKDLLKNYKLKIDLIKLGHHGSKTSSSEEFLKSINVKNSIISSGRNNRYNHPNKETIDTLTKLNINYENTQDKGTIEYKISKKSVTINYTMP